MQAISVTGDYTITSLERSINAVLTEVFHEVLNKMFY